MLMVHNINKIYDNTDNMDSNIANNNRRVGATTSNSKKDHQKTRFCRLQFTSKGKDVSNNKNTIKWAKNQLLSWL